MSKEYFYHFTSAGNAIKILQSGKIFVSPASRVNDPLDIDLNPVVIKFGSEKKLQWYSEELAKKIEKNMVDKNRYYQEEYTYEQIIDPDFHFNDLKNKIRYPDYSFILDDPHVASVRNSIFFIAYSFMNIEENESAILLWSHYGDKHKGVAFCFDFPERFIGFNKLISPVDFKNNERGSSFTPEEYLEFLEGKMASFTQKILSRKHPVWMYENEYRFFGLDLSQSQPLEEMFSGIYFGCDVSEQDKNWIRGLIKSKYKKVKMYQSIKDFYDIKLIYKEVSI